jgi:peptide chain release factor 1
MFHKLENLEKEFLDIEVQLSNPDLLSDQKEYTRLLKRKAHLEEIVDLFRKYKIVEKTIQDSKELLGNEKDEEMIAMAKEDLKAAEEELPVLTQALRVALLPKDPNDDKNIMMELRAGTGGDEAGLFAAELGRMYMRYAETKGWRAEIIEETSNPSGGIKEMILKIHGDKVYSKMKYESGVHRVQRVPETENKGRVHTSTATVAVLPEAEEVDIVIRPEDLRIDVFRSSGNGGQSVNTTDSAVRITHLASGLVVSCQDEKSQLKNKVKAMGILRSRLYAQEQERLQKERGEERLAQIGSGERSEKIRTYNFPQSRLTDHRINTNWSNLSQVMEGDLDDIINKMILEDQARILAGSQE